MANRSDSGGLYALESERYRWIVALRLTLLRCSYLEDQVIRIAHGAFFAGWFGTGTHGQLAQEICGLVYTRTA